jgi:uncharacterized protein (DUF1499 family)
MISIVVLCTCVVVSLHTYAVLGFSCAKTEAPVLPPPEKHQRIDAQRRAIFSTSIVAVSSLICLRSDPASAFDNAVPDFALYADKPKRRGAPPKDLGVLPRTTEGEDDRVTAPGLRTCDGNPNCFSTTGDFLLSDRTQYGVDFLIQPWKFPATDPNPLQTLSSVVKSYKAGEGGIDGGGFKIVKGTDSYLYCQFESLKKGYIDDVEFAVAKDSVDGIQVRSASRVGYTDFGVNAIRLNYLASQLRDKGWTIDEITEKSHRDYWTASDEARAATFDESRRQL